MRVPDRRLVLAIEISTPLRSDDLLAELTGRVLRYLGYVEHDIADVTSAVRAELDQRTSDSSTTMRLLQVSVDSGQLLVCMSDRAGQDWRMTRPLP